MDDGQLSIRWTGGDLLPQDLVETINIIIIIINMLLLSATSDPRQITGNMSVAEMPLALYNNLLRNT